MLHVQRVVDINDIQIFRVVIGLKTNGPFELVGLRLRHGCGARRVRNDCCVWLCHKLSSSPDRFSVLLVLGLEKNLWPFGMLAACRSSTAGSKLCRWRPSCACPNRS